MRQPIIYRGPSYWKTFFTSQGALWAIIITMLLTGNGCATSGAEQIRTPVTIDPPSQQLTKYERAQLCTKAMPKLVNQGHIIQGKRAAFAAAIDTGTFTPQQGLEYWTLLTEFLDGFDSYIIVCAVTQEQAIDLYNSVKGLRADKKLLDELFNVTKKGA